MEVATDNAMPDKKPKKASLGCSLIGLAWVCFMFVVTVGVFLPAVNMPGARILCGDGKLNLDVYTEHPSRVETVTSLSYLCIKGGQQNDISLLAMVLSFFVYFGPLSLLIILVTLIKNRGKEKA